MADPWLLLLRFGPFERGCMSLRFGPCVRGCEVVRRLRFVTGHAWRYLYARPTYFLVLLPVAVKSKYKPFNKSSHSQSRHVT